MRNRDRDLGRLGTVLPPDFPAMPGDKPYPSGTAYEVLSAIDASKGGAGSGSLCVLLSVAISCCNPQYCKPKWV
jgi:hypothetical protein